MRKKSASATSDHQKIGRQTAYQRANQREGSPHYVLLYSDGENSGDEESIPLQSHSQPRKVEVINVQLKPEDTLQALALRYRCTISELKRINNIHRENEIYAHRSIKVPVPPYSLLTESLDQNGHVNEIVAVGGPETNQNDVATSREEKIINLITTPITPLPFKTDINNAVFNLANQQLSQSHGEGLSEIVGETECDRLLDPAVATESPDQRANDSFFTCSGADWGLSWAQLVGCSLLLGFAGPIIYILYLAEYSSKHHPDAGH